MESEIIDSSNDALCTLQKNVEKLREDVEAFRMDVCRLQWALVSDIDFSKHFTNSSKLKLRNYIYEGIEPDKEEK